MSTVAEPISEGTMKLVVFSLGEEEYALPISHVQEVIRYSSPRAVASSSASILGVISLRGKIIPVYDLSLRLGVDIRTDADSKIVIVEIDGVTSGVVVDDVHEVLAVEEDQLETLPGGHDGLIASVVKVRDRLVALLDAETVLGAVGQV